MSRGTCLTFQTWLKTPTGHPHPHSSAPGIRDTHPRIPAVSLLPSPSGMNCIGNPSSKLGVLLPYLADVGKEGLGKWPTATENFLSEYWFRTAGTVGNRTRFSHWPVLSLEESRSLHPQSSRLWKRQISAFASAASQGSRCGSS